MAKPMNTYNASAAGHNGAQAEWNLGFRAPCWERSPEIWKAHSTAYRRAYRAAWKAIVDKEANR